MKSLFIFKSAATIALCAMLFSCSKKIHLSSSQQTSYQQPHTKQQANTNTKSHTSSSLKENGSTPNSLTGLQLEKIQPEKAVSLVRISKPNTKKFIYESGYKPQILKPRPFVPEARYTPCQETPETEVTTTTETVLIHAFAYAGAIVLALVIRRML